MFKKIRFWLATYFIWHAVNCCGYSRYFATNYPVGSTGYEFHKLWLAIADMNFEIANGLVPEFREKEKVEA